MHGGMLPHESRLWRRETASTECRTQKQSQRPWSQPPQPHAAPGSGCGDRFRRNGRESCPRTSPAGDVLGAGGGIGGLAKVDGEGALLTLGARGAVA